MPVNADVPSLDVLTIDEHDPHVNALGIKGVGEIGVTGSAGAVANAVWHATGIRVRRFPIRIEDLVMAPNFESRQPPQRPDGRRAGRFDFAFRASIAPRTRRSRP